MVAILLSLFVYQADPLLAAGNAAVVTVYGINTPATVTVAESDSIEVPVIVLRVDGEPGEGYSKVTSALRYDGSRLEFTGVAPGMVAGTISKPIDIDRDGAAGNSPLRRVTVTFSADKEVTDLGELFVLKFKVRALADNDGAVETAIAWDNATVLDAAGKLVKADKQSPTKLVIKQDRQVALMVNVRKAWQVDQ